MIVEGLFYSRDHEWLQRDGNTVRVGITHHAQDALGSIVFIELPEVGDEVAAGGSLGVLESVKAASDYYSPVSGKIMAVNEELLDTPGLVNDDPYGKGWLVEIELKDPAELDGLLSADGYRELLEKEDK